MKLNIRIKESYKNVSRFMSAFEISTLNIEKFFHVKKVLRFVNLEYLEPFFLLHRI